MNIDKKIEQAESNLERKLDWVGRHDNRVVFVVGVIIAMLGVLATASASIICWTFGLYFMFGLAGLLLFSSLIIIYRSQYPKTKAQNNSLIFFDTISQLKFAEFKQKVKDATDEEYLDDLLSQVHTNAIILKKKFSNLKWALILLGIAILPWLLSIYFSRVYMK